MNYLTKILVLFFIGSFASHSFSKTDNQKFKKLDQMFDLISKYKKANGQALILKNGKIVYQRDYGFKKMPKNPVFHIGSISKTYTAVIIVKLIEEGKLKFDSKLSEFFPEIENAERISIEHMLRHRSGIGSYTSLAEYLKTATKRINVKEQIKRIKKAGINFQPDEMYEYSNSNYLLLGYIAEKLAKANYENLIDQYISRPNQFVNTYLYQQKKPKLNEVGSFQLIDNEWEHSMNTHESHAYSSGAVVSNALEVGTFVRKLIMGSLVSKKNLDKMTLIKNNYGMGLIKVPYNKEWGFGHGGRIGGFQSFVSHFSNGDITIVNLTNASLMNLNDINIGMLASMYGDDFQLPQFKSIIQLPEKELKKYHGTFGSNSFPLKIKIFTKNGILYGQADGQSEFPLESYSKIEFANTVAGLNIMFTKDGTGLNLSQGSQSFVLKKL